MGKTGKGKRRRARMQRQASRYDYSLMRDGQSGPVTVLQGDQAARRLAELRGEIVAEKELATGTPE